MYICICNAITKSELREAARTNDGCAETLYGMLGRVPQCRQCIDEAEMIVADVRAALKAAVPVGH